MAATPAGQAAGADVIRRVRQSCQLRAWRHGGGAGGAPHSGAPGLAAGRRCGAVPAAATGDSVRRRPAAVLPPAAEALRQVPSPMIPCIILVVAASSPPWVSSAANADALKQRNVH